MAQHVYGGAILAAWKGDLDLDTTDTRVFAVATSSYTFSQVDNYLDDVSAQEISDVVAVTGELVSSISGGMKFDCDDHTVTNVTGVPSALIYYDHTGTPTTSALLGYYETGLSGSLSAGTVPVTVNASGLFTDTAS